MVRALLARRGAGLMVAAVAGIMAALGQAPWGLWPIALVAYAAGLAAIEAAPTLRAAALRGWVMGAAHFAVALNWITEPFFIEPEVTGWLAPFALIGLAGGLSLFWAAAAGVGARYGAIGVALALVLAEVARSYVLTGFPWALPGHILIGSPALVWAAWIGPAGLTALVLLPAAVLFAGRRAGSAAVAVWALALAAGWAILAQGPLPADPDAPVIRLVQPNAPQHLKWDPDLRVVFFRRALLATAAAPDGPGPDLIVWPETSLPQILENAAQSLSAIAQATGDATVLVGAQRYDAQGQPRNLAALLDTDGRILASYDKHHLVPFGEYLPLAALFDRLGVGALASQLAGVYASGEGPQTMQIPRIGAVFPMICYEAIFPQYIRTQPRPRVMVHLTNDAWFGTAAGPYQHLALARLRAAEAGVPVMRAANTGVSAVIDARGRVLQALPLGVAGHLDAPLPGALPPTLYIRSGDVPMILLALLTLAGLFLRRRAIGH
jgi:apolipoprotein N-acyltransferase